jgi:hypothetical protein
MLFRAHLLLLSFASLATARISHRSWTDTGNVRLADLVTRQSSISTISQDSDGNVPLFNYETAYLTATEVQAVKSQLQKEYGNSSWSQYWKLLDFATVCWKVNFKDFEWLEIQTSTKGHRSAYIYPVVLVPSDSYRLRLKHVLIIA